MAFRSVFLGILTVNIHGAYAMSAVQKKAVEGEDVTLPCLTCISGEHYREWEIHYPNGGSDVVLICIEATECVHFHDGYWDRAQIDFSSGDLTIYNTRLSDEGAYTESLSNAEVSLEIYVSPAAPAVTGPVGPVVAGAEVSFTCEVPRVKPADANMMSWSLVGGDNLGPGQTTVSQNSDKTFRVTSDLSHVFEKGTPTHVVQCTVTPQEGAGEPVTGHTQVAVQCTKTVTAALNQQDVVVRCSVSANPLPVSYEWQFNGGHLRSGIIDQPAGSITIDEVQMSDFGNYSCAVSNGLEEDGVLLKPEFVTELKLQDQDSGLHVGVIAAIILSVLLVVALIIITVLTKCQCRKKKENDVAKGNHGTNPAEILYEEIDTQNNIQPGNSNPYESVSRYEPPPESVYATLNTNEIHENPLETNAPET